MATVIWTNPVGISFTNKTALLANIRHKSENLKLHKSEKTVLVLRSYFHLCWQNVIIKTREMLIISIYHQDSSSNKLSTLINKILQNLKWVWANNWKSSRQRRKDSRKLSEISGSLRQDNVAQFFSLSCCKTKVTWFCAINKLCTTMKGWEARMS